MSRSPNPQAAIYARIASGRQQDHASIQQQLKICQQAAFEHNFTVCHEFADYGLSGLTLERPALKQLLTYIKAKPVDYLVCTDTARLARDHRLLTKLTATLAARGVQVVTSQTTVTDTRIAPFEERS